MNRSNGRAVASLAIGWTGGIACGKSTAAAMLAEATGVAILDADAVAHELMEPGTPVYRRVAARFGPEVIGPDGRFDRRALGARVFEDPAARAALNRLVHPAVKRAWRTWLAERARRGEAGVVIVPLLFEAGAETGWDAVVCIAASPETAARRLRDRGWTEEEARRRIAAQWPVEDKVRRADYVIWNDEDRETLRTRVLATWRRITDSKGVP
jgi:dephospho-CoA kinase